MRCVEVSAHILVDDRYGAVCQQLCEGVACVDVLAAVCKVLQRQQHLCTRLQEGGWKRGGGQGKCWINVGSNTGVDVWVCVGAWEAEKAIAC